MKLINLIAFLSGFSFGLPHLLKVEAFNFRLTPENFIYLKIGAIALFIFSSLKISQSIWKLINKKPFFLFFIFIIYMIARTIAFKIDLLFLLKDAGLIIFYSTFYVLISQQDQKIKRIGLNFFVMGSFMGLFINFIASQVERSTLKIGLFYLLNGQTMQGIVASLSIFSICLIACYINDSKKIRSYLSGMLLFFLLLFNIYSFSKLGTISFFLIFIISSIIFLSDFNELFFLKKVLKIFFILLLTSYLFLPQINIGSGLNQINFIKIISMDLNWLVSGKIENPSNQLRINYFTKWQPIESTEKIFGVGNRGFLSISQKNLGNDLQKYETNIKPHPHNSFLYFLYTYGFFGLVFILWFYYFVTKNIYNFGKEAKIVFLFKSVMTVILFLYLMTTVNIFKNELFVLISGLIAKQKPNKFLLLARQQKF